MWARHYEDREEPDGLCGWRFWDADPQTLLTLPYTPCKSNLPTPYKSNLPTFVRVLSLLSLASCSFSSLHRSLLYLPCLIRVLFWDRAKRGEV